MVPLVPSLGPVCGVGDAQLRDQQHLPGGRAGPPHGPAQTSLLVFRVGDVHNRSCKVSTSALSGFSLEQGLAQSSG